MERDLLLFIVIIIVTVVLNIIKAVKKKQAKPVQRQSTEEGKSGETDMQDILRELLGGEKPEKAVAEIDEEADEVRAHQSKRLSTADYQFDDPDYTKPSKAIGKNEVQQTTDSTDFTSPTSSYDLEDDDADEKSVFDLRSGVIKQAILNRPYN